MNFNLGGGAGVDVAPIVDPLASMMADLSTAQTGLGIEIGGGLLAPDVTGTDLGVGGVAPAAG
jgi:hypothetical protein